MYDALHEALHSLQATRATGFEGVILAHISRLTGRRFFLAKTGPQAGKDASTAGSGVTYIDIECKKYRRGASPTSSDLLGGLVEAIHASAYHLDLWLVVSTGVIGSTDAEVLKQTANREAVSVEISDWQEAGLPQLAVLCAAFLEETIAELQARGVSGDLTAIAADLKAVEERVKQLIAEARHAGHYFFGRPMHCYALPEVIARHPERVAKWIAFLAQRDTMPWDTAEFYRALCAAVGGTDPDRAADILAQLRRASTGSRRMYHPWNVDSLTWLAFQLPSSQKVDEVRERLLEEADTDEQLFQIALAAQANGTTDWLARVIQRDLWAPGVYLAARALTLIGFLDEGALLAGLRHELDGRTGFLNDVATCAGGRLERNQRACAWFAKFLARRDPVEAWAAFRLFLCCIDRRFYLWGDVMRNATLDLPLLWHQQVSINDQDIRHAAEKNEGKLPEILFGQRISKNEIAPWYRTPLMANTT